MTPVAVHAFGLLLRRDFSVDETIPGRAVFRGTHGPVSARAALWPHREEPRWHVFARFCDSAIGLDVSITGSARTLVEAEQQVIERAQRHAPLLHQLITAAESRSTNAA